jgi:hypothetical protein
MARARGKRRDTEANAPVTVTEEAARPAEEPAPSAPPPASPSWTQTAASWLGSAPTFLGAVFILLFLVVAVRRIRYPFALEWIEGGLLDEVRWLLAGHNLYVRPSVDFVPFIYNPLYFWVCAGASKVFGVSLFTLRLVSLASSVGTLALLYKLVLEETESQVAGVVGAGLYAATFKQTQQFMDVARVDALFVLLVVASLWALRTRRTAPGQAAAAALLVLCFLAKQSGMFVAAPLAGFVLWERATAPGGGRLRGVPFAAAVLGGIGASAWLLDATSDGWYRYFAFELPRSHRLVSSLWTDFWTVDLMGPLGCACLGALFVLFGPGAMARRERALWGAALAGVLLCSWSSRLHDGGWSNVLMPAYAVLSALFAIAFHEGLGLARRATPDVRARLEVFLPLAATVQLAMMAYDPSHLVPTRRDEAAGWRVVSALRGASGDTFTPTDSYLASLAGKRPHLHQMAVDDILRAPESEVGTRLVADLRGAFARKRWAMVITDNDFFATEVLANYQRGADSIGEADVFYPVTGVHYRPGWIYTPR